MSDWVTIRNPAVQGTAEVTRAAAAAYAEKGWQIVEEQPPTEPAEAPEALVEPDEPLEQPDGPAPEPPAEDVPSDTPIADSLTAEAPTTAPEV